jgi:hypothetical protein
MGAKLDQQNYSSRGTHCGVRKPLEFPTGGDQRKTITRVGTEKAQHLNQIIIA